MSKRLRTVLIIILLLVFAGSLGGLIWNLADREKGRSSYEEAESIAKLSPPPPDAGLEPGAEIEEDPYFESLAAIDLAALQEVNPDVLGWILIPDTEVSYPLLLGRDNDYYLHRTWNGKSSALGAIFLECRNNESLSDFHTIIYGHRMKNGTMFGSLRNYNQQDYWTAHPYVYIMTGTSIRRYSIFSAYTASVTGRTYQIDFANDGEKQAFLDEGLSLNVLSTGLTPAVTDQIITLSTCYGNTYATRWVVQASLAEIDLL